MLAVAMIATAAIPGTAPPAEAGEPQVENGSPQPRPGPQAQRTPKRCSRDAKATLVLDGKADEFVADTAFKRTTGTRMMTLVYDVTGCQLAPANRRPSEPLRIYPPKTGGQVPDGAIELARAPSVENGGKRYLVPLKISSDKLSPGTYAGLVEIASPVINPVRSPVAVSRSEDNIFIPLAWGAVGALGGFLLFAALRFFKGNDLLVPLFLVFVAGAVSLVVGAIAALATSYLNQDVWTSSENAWAVVVIGFTASTSGVMTALLAAVWSEPGEGREGDDPLSSVGMRR
ncbi:MAG: hypothetical protein QOH58_3537 [Thermoleophilaceae bacterium]|jgi:hypothetical protein|nr:hypothetical protein [Thermoleophilaceae bacterium]